MSGMTGIDHARARKISRAAQYAWLALSLIHI